MRLPTTLLFLCLLPAGAALLAPSSRAVRRRTCLMAAAAPADPADAVLSIFDEKTQSRVVLVGTMHFNPVSIALAERVVREEAASGRLRAVAVESCPSRWNATLEAQPPGWRA